MHSEPAKFLQDSGIASQLASEQKKNIPAISEQKRNIHGNIKNLSIPVPKSWKQRTLKEHFTLSSRQQSVCSRTRNHKLNSRALKLSKTF